MKILPVLCLVFVQFTEAERILDFCKSNMGKQVGNGQCSELAIGAIRAVNGKPLKIESDGEYTWGKLTATITVKEHPVEQVKAGDILQFKDVKIAASTGKVKGIATLKHHTAVVIANNNGIATILHQNISGNMTVVEWTVDFRNLKEGTIKAYRIDK